MLLIMNQIEFNFEYINHYLLIKLFSETFNSYFNNKFEIS